MSQAVPTVQSVQVPTWQTLLVPQDAPSSRAVTASVQVGVPPVHDSVPLWQALVGTQLVPALQATHAPAEHTLPEPQGVPSSALPDSRHTEVPVAQLIWPSLHT